MMQVGPNAARPAIKFIFMISAIANFIRAILASFFNTEKKNPQPIEPIEPQVDIAPEPEQLSSPEPEPKEIDWISICQNALKINLNDSRREAITLIVSFCKTYGVTDVRHICYILATCYHESDFRSIKERRARPGTAVWKMQEKYWHTGYYGRSYCQLTWQRNYAKFAPVVGIDIVKYPDEVLQPVVGARILVYGMANGSFTGNGLKSSNKLSKYIAGERCDFMNARRIVNGTFMADKVAAHADKLLAQHNITADF